VNVHIHPFAHNRRAVHEVPGNHDCRARGLLDAGHSVVLPGPVIVEVGLLGQGKGRTEATDRLLGNVVDERL